MLSEKLLSGLNSVLQAIRKCKIIFGGMQVICVGDFNQLPPVPSTRYDDPGKFCFTAEVWQHMHKLILKEIHRQSDYDLIKVQQNSKLYHYIYIIYNIFLLDIGHKFQKFSMQYSYTYMYIYRLLMKLRQVICQLIPKYFYMTWQETYLQIN